MKLTKPDYVQTAVAGIELFLFGPLADKQAPLVFVLHGAGGNIHSSSGYCRELARMGCIAVAFEQRNHGRRLADARCNLWWGSKKEDEFFLMMNNMYEIILGTATDVRLLVDALPARLGLEPRRIGVTGFSLGGHATLAAMAMEPRLDVGVPFIGGGDFYTLMKLRTMQNHHSVNNFETYFKKALAPLVKRFDAIEHGPVFAPRPLLMVNGGSDDVVQLECNRNFHAVLSPLYKKTPDRLKLSVYEPVKHEVTPAMWAEGKAWLKRWLF